jgi:putative chitinase
MTDLRDRMEEIIKASALGRPNASNMTSFVVSMNKFGPEFNMLLPHRFVQIGGQVMQESGEFRYDREIWDGKGAQARYDTRTDLGNTPERDGDGFTYRGRGPIQITGKSNYRQFTAWAKKRDPNAPDFVKCPDLINTDPWEGLVVIWYWSTRDLNKHADVGDTRRITRRINGGYNHLAERIKYTTRMSLVTLGYGPEDPTLFQKKAGLKADGIAGSNTRAALHKSLVARQTLIL